MNRKLREKIDQRLSKERGTIFKDPGAKITVALVYPNTYRVGMSNLGFQGIYGLLNRMNDVVCERAFLPDTQDIAEYSRTGTELFSMESKRPLNRFAIVAFSVSFENDYPNILTILKMANIPVRSSQRSERHPVIIMGGACAFFNPEPVADFFDLCFIGEGDDALGEFISIFRTSSNRTDLFAHAVRIEGMYVPRFYRVQYHPDGRISGRTAEGDAPEIITRRYIRDLSCSGIKASVITPEAEFSDMYLIEAMRGCPWHCRFCVAGKIYSPPRIKKLDAVSEEIRSVTGSGMRIGLVGPSLTDYPHIREVLQIPGVEYSITSLRAGRRSADMAALLRGHKSISIAPEAGTTRLRKVINKQISEEDILSTAKLLFEQGIETLRLYFMVGLPTETREDIAGLIDLVIRIRHSNPKGSITLSISTFVPKPFTPFQWHPMQDMGEIKECLKMIKRALSPMKGIRVFHDTPKYAFMQGLFAMGDRRVSNVLEEMLRTEDWNKAAAATGIDKDFYISRAKDGAETLPWDFIDMGIEKERLWAEYSEAKASL